jgi:lipid-A-disaccharide synthase
MAVILPFEKEFYEGYQVPVSFVGHPLLDQGAPVQPGTVPEMPGDGVVVGLLPGSRAKEIERHLPVMLGAAERIAARLDQPVSFRVSLAPSVDPNLVADMLSNWSGKIDAAPVRGGADKVYRHCHLAVAVSGTVTLEAALACTPMVIVYRVSPISYHVGRLLIRVKHIGLINLIAGREVVPELIQHDASAEKISDLLWHLLSDRQRLERMRQELAVLRKRFGGPGASQRVAQIALGLLDRRGAQQVKGRVTG